MKRLNATISSILIFTLFWLGFGMNFISISNKTKSIEQYEKFFNKSEINLISFQCIGFNAIIDHWFIWSWLIYTIMKPMIQSYLMRGVIMEKLVMTYITITWSIFYIFNTYLISLIISSHYFFGSRYSIRHSTSFQENVYVTWKLKTITKNNILRKIKM